MTYYQTIASAPYRKELMMETTFNCALTQDQRAEVSRMGGELENMGDGTYNVTFSSEKAWQRFELWTEERGIDARLI